MNIQKNIQGDMKLSMKQKDRDRLAFNRVILGEFDRVGKDLTFEQQLKVIKKMHKNAVTMGNTYEQGILEWYLPEPLSQQELEECIRTIIDENEFTGVKQLGPVMKILKGTHGERVDGKAASRAIAAELNKL